VPARLSGRSKPRRRASRSSLIRAAFVDGASTAQSPVKPKPPLVRVAFVHGRRHRSATDPSHTAALRSFAPLAASTRARAPALLSRHAAAPPRPRSSAPPSCTAPATLSRRSKPRRRSSASPLCTGASTAQPLTQGTPPLFAHPRRLLLRLVHGSQRCSAAGPRAPPHLRVLAYPPRAW
jgi:hypothetical protein